MQIEEDITYGLLGDDLVGRRSGGASGLLHRNSVGIPAVLVGSLSLSRGLEEVEVEHGKWFARLRGVTAEKEMKVPDGKWFK